MATERASRIIVVDDEAPQLKALCNTLHDQGYDAAGFRTGEAALEAIGKDRFELLLADLMMPGMDGIALLKAALKLDPEMVGIIMTGEGTIATAVDAMKAGALDYILKPFKVSIILPVLSRALAMRQLRIENRDLQRRLGERAAELEAAYKELEAFSYSISHDLRGPLRAIGGYCQILERDLRPTLGDLHRHLLEVIVSSGGKMTALIEDLLKFSKAGRAPLAARPIDMNALVGEVWAELQTMMPEIRAQLDLGNLPPAQADPVLLKQAWINLLSNAMKYSCKRELPQVSIGARHNGGDVVYWVRDNGVGFDMRQAERLFVAFQRLHGESEFPGTGVGLAIVHRVVTRHGGRVWTEAVKDRGATFYFSLPVLSAEG